MWYAVALKKHLLAMPIHLQSSQVSRWEVSPFITYRESVTILTGVHVLMDCSATSTTAISPTWLDCSGPRIFIAQFSGWFSSIHIPLPHVAFSFPLFMQEPSIMTLSLCVGLLVTGIQSWYAGICITLSGSVKMRKHSDRLFFMVTDGLNRILPCFCFIAREFFSRHWCVSVRLSFLGDVFGLNFGRRLSRITFVVVSHLCGSAHPAALSLEYFVHVQLCLTWCVLRFESLSVADLRFLMVSALWVHFRHSFFFVVYFRWGSYVQPCQ